MSKYEEILKQVDETIEKPFVTARFGDHWKEHQKHLLEIGQIDLDMIINLAWIQGRRVVLMEKVIKELLKENKS